MYQIALTSVLICLAAIFVRAEQWTSPPQLDASGVLPAIVGIDPKDVIPKDSSLESPAVYAPYGSVIITPKHDTVKLKFDSYVLCDRVMKRAMMHIASDTVKNNVIGIARKSVSEYTVKVNEADKKNWQMYIEARQEIYKSGDDWWKGAGAGAAASVVVMVILLLIPRL